MLTTAEEMAVEVLRGNLTAAKALADMLIEDESVGVALPPVHRIVVERNKVRVAVFFPLTVAGEAVLVDIESVREQIHDWLLPNEEVREPGPLVLVGATRIELFEIP